jgi:uncharacterized protein (TIGR02145 family)
MYNLYYIVKKSGYLLLIISSLISCKKDFSRQAAVVTNSFNKANANASGKIIDLGQGQIEDHGFCWDSTGFPSVSTSIKSLGPKNQTGTYTALLEGLKPQKLYYLKAFVKINGVIEYGELISFITPDLPTISTDTVTNILETSASSGGNISSDGGSPVLSRGVCWGKSQNPDIYGEHTNDSLGTGHFTSVMMNLTAGNKYFVRAFARNIYGTNYGQEVSFSTGQPATVPVVTTAEVTSIEITTASSGGNVVSDGGAAVTERGVCWSKNPYPTISDNKTSDGSGTGPFTSSLSSLIANTTYYLRSYATNVKGTAYGDEKTFTTKPNPGIPTVTTSAISNITSNSASSGGTVLEDGGASVSVRGVCWSTNPSPLVSDNKTMDGAGVGSFTSQINGLNYNTKYYLRAYASNSIGTGYGNESSFTAGQNVTTPTVTTTDVTNIAQTTATCGGNVIADGGASVTARGVCWSIFENPTTSNSHTTDGSGTGGYLSSITGLFSVTSYYVRAYATNSAGTAYGNQKSFTTLAQPTEPSVTTAPVTNVTNNSALSGGTVTNDGGATVTDRGVCWSATGYPTISDPHTSNGNGTGSYTSPITGLLGNTFYRVRAYATNSVGTAYGNVQTFSTLQDPVLPTVTTTQPLNITSTTATSGGTVMTDGGSPVTARGVCWSTTSNPTTANSHTNDGTGTGAFTSNLTGLTPATQYYVRAYATNAVGTAYGNECVFNTLSAATLPTVTTASASNITQTTVTSGGNVTSDGGATVTVRGVCWSTSSNPTTANSFTTDGSGTGTFTSNITGLTANTLYYVRAYATNSIGTAYGNEISFTTSSTGTSCPGVPTVTYEGKIYNTVQIGTQCWLKENLNVGTRINGSQNQTNNSIKEKYCFNDLETNCDVYGGLYQWDEAMQYVLTNGAQGLCPNGWHIATDAEWTTMTNYIGGALIAGGKLKEAGLIHWASPNTGATNLTDFTALPSGHRNTNSLFFYLTYSAYFWQSTESSALVSYARKLDFNSEDVFRNPYEKPNGFSVRCLQGNGGILIPTVTTSPISNIAQTSATSGGNVTSDGGATVSARGVCWSTSSNPTTTNSHTSDGSGTGAFTSNLTGLSANTFYYVRAYATNSVGTAYGNEITFTTSSFSIGQNYGGGIIFYIDGTNQHGLIASTTDQSTGATWGCEGTSVGAAGTIIGSGTTNTNNIVTNCSTSGIAARICDDLILNGYTDWFLPSKDELGEMYNQRVLIGGFTSAYYWSSSEYNPGNSWIRNMTNGNQQFTAKSVNYYVRAIRSF